MDQSAQTQDKYYKKNLNLKQWCNINFIIPVSLTASSQCCNASFWALQFFDNPFPTCKKLKNKYSKIISNLYLYIYNINLFNGVECTLAALVLALAQREIADSCLSISKYDIELLLSSAESNTSHLKQIQKNCISKIKILIKILNKSNNSNRSKHQPDLFNKNCTISQFSSSSKAFINFLQLDSRLMFRAQFGLVFFFWWRQFKRFLNPHFLRGDRVNYIWFDQTFISFLKTNGWETGFQICAGGKRARNR